MELDLTNEMSQLEVVAGMYRKHEKWAQAEEVYKTLLVLQKKSHGLYSHAVALTQYRLGDACRAQGIHDRARRYYNDAIEVWTQLEKMRLANSDSKLCMLDALSALQELSTSQERGESLQRNFLSDNLSLPRKDGSDGLECN